MHVVFVSHCSGRSIARTRRVLDGYAQRSGETTWMTPITAEGLAEVRALLKRGASRNTAVACFRNDGYRRMRLLWTVGRAGAFDGRGASPIATHKRKVRPTLPPWARLASLLAAAAGFGHDFGKFGKAFQDKLRAAAPTADPVRHEWISLALLRRMLERDESMGQAWAALFREGSNLRELWLTKAPFDGPITDAKSALLFEIATHHRLPAEFASATAHHVRDPAHRPTMVAAPSPQVEAAFGAAFRRLVAGAPAQAGVLYWRAVSTVSRMALVLADHLVSAAERRDTGAAAYANTDRSSGQLNQALDWHLLEVGEQAGRMVSQILSLRPPCADETDVRRLTQRSPSGPYAWQNRAASAVQASVAQRDVPHLILNLAATGSGKTRLNARLAACARPAHAVRFATALNLRTLTLQTADAYREQIGIGPDALACVMGDRLTAALHEHQKTLARRQGRASDKTTRAGGATWDDDENTRDIEFEVRSSFAYDDAPPWLDHFLRRTTPLMRSVIGAPILVSTIDYLVAAGELPRQAVHALAALRVMTSDLVLDEIDGYDPQALVAVLRLVMLASLAGRHVIASSATLSRPVATMLFRAYRFGACLRRALDEPDGTEPAAFRVVLIDDIQPPQVLDASAVDDFTVRYEAYVQALLRSLGHERLRIPVLAPVDAAQGEAGFFQAVRGAASSLHAEHHHLDPVTGRRYSIGLVRMANVRPAVMVASDLARNLSGARVCCYHANLLAIHRFHVERSLDSLLCRKPGARPLHGHPLIREVLSAATTDEVLFVVVATPVEEIGRDHDFDWAVIEPSSSQSIVQTAGRVNRHRRSAVTQPNVALLQFNFRKVMLAGASRGAVFVRPGLEAEGTHRSHDLAVLLDWSRLNSIDARVRFSGHPFAEYDDAALVHHSESWMKQLFSDGADGARKAFFWMYQSPYEETPLRERSVAQIEVRVEVDGDRSGYALTLNDSGEPVGRQLDELRRSPSDWLVPTDAELLALAREAQVDGRDAMTVRVRAYDEDDIGRLRRHSSFGFFLQPRGF
jgi:CRISPR-associated endonuclease/helicase Cas3